MRDIWYMGLYGIRIGFKHPTKSDSETPLDSETRDSETARRIQKLFRRIQKLFSSDSETISSDSETTLTDSETISSDSETIFLGFRNYFVGFRNYFVGFRNYFVGFRNYFPRIQKLFRRIQKLFRRIQKLFSSDSETISSDSETNSWFRAMQFRGLVQCCFSASLGLLVRWQIWCQLHSNIMHTWDTDNSNDQVVMSFNLSWRGIQSTPWGQYIERKIHSTYLHDGSKLPPSVSNTLMGIVT